MWNSWHFLENCVSPTRRSQYHLMDARRSLSSLNPGRGDEEDAEGTPSRRTRRGAFRNPESLNQEGRVDSKPGSGKQAGISSFCLCYLVSSSGPGIVRDENEPRPG
jgi:hypothetical protein